MRPDTVRQLGSAAIRRARHANLYGIVGQRSSRWARFLDPIRPSPRSRGVEEVPGGTNDGGGVDSQVALEVTDGAGLTEVAHAGR